MKKFSASALLVGSLLSAQTPAIFSSGLLNPSKLLLTPGGNLLVAEAANSSNGGRISLVDKSGVRKTLIDGLPSGLAAPNLEADGPDGLLLQGNTLYILNGEGDGFRAGAKPNTIVPNPAAPSSPILSSLIKLTLPGDIDSSAGGFVMAAADHYTLADGAAATLKGSDGTSATLELVADFRDGIADPVTAWRNSHPYGIAALDGQPDRLYVVDAGMNTLNEVTISTGRSRVLTRFAPFRNTTAGPPVSEAVPDSVRAYGDQLLVSFLRGFPFAPNGSQVASVDPVTGAVTPFIANLSSNIDVLPVFGSGPRPVFFTAEYSANQGATPPAPGRVTRYDTAQGTVIASGLNGPSSLAYDAASQTLYIAIHNDGTILKITGR